MSHVGSPPTPTPASPFTPTHAAQLPAAGDGGDANGDIDAVVARAADAFGGWSSRPRAERADALRAVATALDAAAETLVPIAMRETHLARARLTGELARTTFQLRLFADVVDEGGHLNARIDHADPDWGMGPRPDLRRTRVPFGPVVVFAASNFPFAFSVAGGDTASALAAGCTVILKSHPGHPELSRATGDVVRTALQSVGAPDGVFSLISGDAEGRAVLTHPAIRAGAFTGSVAAGRVLFALACERPEPIPFYGELGSVNPVFVTPEADAERGAEVAAELVGSVTLGSGQFCTKPGVVFVPRGSAVLAALGTLDLPAGAPMLNARISEGYRRTLDGLRGHRDVRLVRDGSAEPPAATVLRTTLDAVRADPDQLLGECFGPTVLIVEYDDVTQLHAAAAGLEGQLTATLVAGEQDAGVPALVEELSRKAGRVLWNQWPTGVSVTYAQQHGGPYPATTAPGTTSVGTAAIDRFTRPVAFQGFPQALLPVEVRDDARQPRRVDGAPMVPSEAESVRG